MVLTRRPIEKKGKVIPRKRWFASVTEDLKELDVKDWRDTATNRGKWKKIMKLALGLQGL